MALGVLNNLSAIYAEHNLNNTNNSLQQVLHSSRRGRGSIPVPTMQPDSLW